MAHDLRITYACPTGKSFPVGLLYVMGLPEDQEVRIQLPDRKTHILHHGYLDMDEIKRLWPEGARITIPDA